MEEEDGDFTVTIVFEGDLTTLLGSLTPMDNLASLPLIGFAHVTPAPASALTSVPTLALAPIFPLPLARADRKENTVFF